MKRLLLVFALAVPNLVLAADAVTPARLKRDLEQGARLFRQGPENSSAHAYAARLSWVDVEWNDTTITVRDPWLDDAVAALERLPADARKRQLEAIADHLAARATQVFVPPPDSPVPTASPGATPETPPEEILQGILDQSRFRTPPEDPKLAQTAARFRDALRRAWTSVKEFATDLFRPREGGGTFEQIKQIALLGLAAVTVVGIAWFAIRLLLRAAVDTAADDPETEMPEAPPQPAEMAAEARARTATGDHRGAIRALYLALLGALHQQGAIVYDRHRTNREYLRSMRAGPHRKSAFEELVDVFDRKWYGREACSRQDVETFERAVALAGDATQDRRERGTAA